MLNLIKKENQESEVCEQQLQQNKDDLQNEAVQPSRKKKWLSEIFKKPTSSDRFRAEDIAAREIDRYINSPCPEVDSNPLEWWKTHYLDCSHLACLAKNRYVFLPQVWHLIH